MMRRTPFVTERTLVVLLAFASACAATTPANPELRAQAAGGAGVPTCRPTPWTWAEPRTVVPEIVGFSQAGWIAYIESDVRGPDPGGGAAMQVQNLACEADGCYADTPTYEGDVCYCPGPGGEELLDEFGIARGRRFESGVFPADISGARYDVATERKTGGGIAPGSSIVSTEVWLQREGGGRKRIGSLRDHDTSRVDLVCTAGWIRSSSQATRIAVLVGYAVAEDGEVPSVVRFKIMGAELTGGF